MIYNPEWLMRAGPVLPAKDTLENTSWEGISAVAKAGLAAEYWSIGDIKSIAFNGETYYVQIIGFDHDDVSDAAAYGRDKAGITFQFGVAGDSAKAGAYGDIQYMNLSSTNKGGWRDSNMRTAIMPTMKGYLPADLQSILVVVDKVSTEGGKTVNQTVVTTQDDLFLLSEVEIFGAHIYSSKNEIGMQYKFYADGGSTIRYSKGSAMRWWERSTDYDESTMFCLVDGSGRASSITAGSPYYASFAFCV